jgi:pimeloyl-ACP methyl ester carboxylesterase
VSTQANRVAAVLESMGAHPVVVIGHSSGGYVATALAEQRRDLVRAVALINTGPCPEALRPQPAIVRVMTTPPLSRVGWSLRSLTIRRGLTTAFTRPVDIPDDLVAAVQGMRYHAFMTAARESSAYISERAVPERLAVLEVPVLVIFGAEDHRWDPASAHNYDKVPDARLEMLPGIGHTPMFEAPDITSKLLIDFAGLVEDPSATASEREQ